MGRIKRLSDLINGKLPSPNSAIVRTRGIAHPLDVFLTGRLRFARKVGSPLPIWLPDNQTSLTESVKASASTIKVADVVSWFRPGTKLLIDGKSFAFIDDILDDGLTLSLTEGLLTEYSSGTTVDLYGHPLEVFGTFSPPSPPTYVPDVFVRGLNPLGSVRVATSTNTLLAGELVVDGVSMTTGDRVLLTGQTDPTTNGVWVVSAFNWSRPADFEGGTSATSTQVFVTAGTYAGSSWVCTSLLGLDLISDPFALPFPLIGNVLTWSRLATVSTFLVHSDHPIYPGDVINYKFGEYDVAEALSVGVTSDGRTTYQVTIDVGIPETLENGRTDQVFLRGFPSYESELRPLPNIPLTSNNVGPFLYDRLSGSFFEDLDVPEVDVVSLYTSSRSLVLREKNAGKNYVVYNTAIPPDSFLFWNLDRGRINYSKSRQTFVGFADTDGHMQIHYECVPKIPPIKDFQGWRVQVTAQQDTYMSVQLEPNVSGSRAPGALVPSPPPPRGGVFLPAGSTVSVNVDFPDTSLPVSKIYVCFDTLGVSEGRIDMESWEIRGVQTTSFFSHATIAKVTGRNVWASGPAFAKPYWLRLTYLQVQTDLYSRFNGGLLAL